MLGYLLEAALFLVGGMCGFFLFKARKPVFDAQEELAKLKRTVEERDLDWVDMRARCKRLLDRTEKAAAALKPEVQSAEPTSNGGGVVSELRPLGRALTAHQLEVQQQILKRRAGM